MISFCTGVEIDGHVSVNKKIDPGSCETAHWVTGLTANLSLIPKTHMVQAENHLLKVVL